MDIQFVGLPSADVARIRASGRDAYDQPVERRRAGADGWPCRHCLGQTPPARDMLILAWRPFASSNPYAETGPIFLCADDCAAATPGDQVPAILRSDHYILRGYTADERILYGTGQVTARAEIAQYARRLLDNRDIAFVDLRSAANNCFQCRVLRVP